MNLFESTFKASRDNRVAESKPLVESVNMDEILKAKSVLRAAGYDIDSLTTPDEVIESALKQSFSRDVSIDKMKHIISLLYDEDRTGYILKHIDRFVTDHGVSEESPSIFEGLSDEAVKELYDEMCDKIIDVYGGEYDRLDRQIVQELELDAIL